TALSSVSALEYAQLDDAVIKNFTTQAITRFITLYHNHSMSIIQNSAIALDVLFIDTINY
ncbi:MAG: hypothetical protein ACJBCI_08015, partial [Candidatus Tisiphia sp.]